MFDNKNIEDLLKIFNITKKKDLVSFCKDVVIHDNDFVNLIILAESGCLPYLHQIHHKDFVPEHLLPDKNDRSSLSENGTGILTDKSKKLFTKINQAFKDRRFLAGHLFYTVGYKYWHFFYFDQRDLSNDENHWSGGPHIHLINYLWPNFTAEKVWDQFTKGKPDMKNSIHIRYIEE